MVEPQDPAAKRAWREILETLFSPDDAALAARLPVIPTTVADLARRTGLDAGALRVRLEAMAGKGLVLDLHDARTGATTYMLAPPVVGFFELSMMRLNDGLPKARLARAYEAYMAGDRAFDEEVSGIHTVVGRTLVHGVSESSACRIVSALAEVRESPAASRRHAGESRCVWRQSLAVTCFQVPQRLGVGAL